MSGCEKRFTFIRKSYTVTKMKYRSEEVKIYKSARSKRQKTTAKTTMICQTFSEEETPGH